jgi:microcystin-dependent protein
MKNLPKIILILLLGFALKVNAQNVPQGFKYQSAIRDNTGALLANKLVALKLSFLHSNPTGAIVYIETHNTTTNDFGIANLNIGMGTPQQGTFADIDWSNGPYFLKTELDVNNGINFLFMGTNQLLSVPYALFAGKAANASDDKDKDSLNEIQQINLNANLLLLNKSGGSINLDKYLDNTDSQTLSISNRKISITNGNFVTLNDNDSLNEIQNISLAGDQLQLSKNGGSLNLSKYTDNTDSQTLTLQGTNLSISRGNTITLSGAVDLDSDPSNEIQSLSINIDTIRISKANYIRLPKINDVDSTNEIQTLILNGNKLSLSKSNQVNIDTDTTNELQTLIKNNNQISLSKTNQVMIDGDTANEIQSLNLVNDSISLSKSNKIFMPGVPVGTIVAYAGRNVPSGWLLCDGSELNRNDYSRLFFEIDSIWGAGNRVSTYNLPDLRGQFLRGVTGSSQTDPDSLGRVAKFQGGNFGNKIGSYQSDTLKSHNHQMPQGYFTNGSGGNNWSSYSGNTAMDRFNPSPTLSFGGTETRPKNAYVYYIIKY